VSATTIEIPAGQVEAIRQSLLGRRGDAERPEEVDGLLAQMASDARPCQLTGSRGVLWNAIYDSLCAAAEQLADDCNEYWHGVMAPDSVRAAIGDVDTRLELLVALGPPPGS